MMLGYKKLGKKQFEESWKYETQLENFCLSFVFFLVSLLDKYLTLTFKYRLISNISTLQVFRNLLESLISLWLDWRWVFLLQP